MFFVFLGETVKASGTNITQAFDLFRAAVEEAGRNWAENTGGQAPSLAAIDNVIDLEKEVSFSKD